MQDKIYKRFLTSNALACLISLIVIFIFSIWQAEYFSSWYYLLPAYGFLLNFAVFRTIKKIVRKGNLQLIVTSLFGIKFFGYIIPIIVAIIIKPEKEIILMYVLLVFIFYIIYTIVITRSVLQIFNSVLNHSDNSK